MTLTSALLLMVSSFAVSVFLSVVVIVSRLVRNARNTAAEKRRVRLRPYVLHILDEQPPTIDSLRERRALAAIVSDYSGHVRGGDRGLLVRWLESMGFDLDCIVRMRSPFPFRRAHALRHFAPLAGSHIAVMTQMITDRNPRVRMLAAQIAGLSGNDAFVPVLLNSIVSPRRRIPVGIVSMAILRTAPANAAPFASALRSSDPSSRSLAIELAGRLTLADARVPIEDGLRALDERVRAASLNALERIGSPLSQQALQNFSARSEKELALLVRAQESVSGL